MKYRFLPPLALILLVACAATKGQQKELPTSDKPAEQGVALNIRSLPGGLNQTPVLNSNSPEIISHSGILISTLPSPVGAPANVFLDYPFQGDFGVFSHHIAKDEKPGDRLLYLGLLATNRSPNPVLLDMKQGASYLSQPDAVFKPLDPMIDDPKGRVYAGPGARVATDLLHGRSPLRPDQFKVAPDETALLYSWPINTDVAILPPINGRSSTLYMHSDGPIYLSHVALFAEKKADGTFTRPRLPDYMTVLDAGLLTGPREAADPCMSPPQKGFRYGRVSGISEGDRWSGDLFAGERELPAVGEKVAFPIASVCIKRLGTTPVQSADFLRRYEGTAYEAHGNYGVTYALRAKLDNHSRSERSYTFQLSSPVRVDGGKAVYLTPPGKPVMFRGPIQLKWTDAAGQVRQVNQHLVLRHGEDVPAFAEVNVPAGQSYDAEFTIIYPADATPPQLLTVGRTR